MFGELSSRMISNDDLDKNYKSFNNTYAGFKQKVYYNYMLTTIFRIIYVKRAFFSFFVMG